MKDKKTLFLAGAFALVFLAGVMTMRVWDAWRGAPAASAASQAGQTESLLIVDMDEASEPEGVAAVAQPAYVDDSTIPSQLSKIKVQGLKSVVSRSGGNINAPQNADGSPVVLGNVDRTAQPTGTASQPAPLPDDTSITMINAPVSAKVLKTADEYKTFKRKARGSYPDVNFGKEYLLVLESSSNLPDKVFEIQSAAEKNGKLEVIYRVNIFGLDQKTNTHSVTRVPKKNLPLDLKQVL